MEDILVLAVFEKEAVTRKAMVTVLQYYSTTVLQYYSTTVLQYYSTTVLQPPPQTFLPGAIPFRSKSDNVANFQFTRKASDKSS